MKTPLACKLYRLAIYCLFFMLSLPSVHADSDTEQQIKLSFIYNFAKFVTWPNVSSPAAPLMLCVLGSQPLASNIALLQDKKVNMRTIQVRFLNQNKKIADCNMLFISESEALRMQEILASLANQSILTVSTIPEFTQTGGMIGLKELNNRLRFDINLLAAQKAGLIVNSQLSSLADEVIQ